LLGPIAGQLLQLGRMLSAASYLIESYPGHRRRAAARILLVGIGTAFCQPFLQGILVNADLTAETDER
jgi:hypothetical protein